MEPFLHELLGLFYYPPGSGRAWFTGTLHLRYCAARFACLTPTWRLPASDHVDCLLAAHSDSAGDCVDEVVGLRVFRGCGSGSGRKRIRLNRKTPAHLVLLGLNLVHEFGRGCVRMVFQVLRCLTTLGGVVIMFMGVLFMNMTESLW